VYLVQVTMVDMVILAAAHLFFFTTIVSKAEIRHLGQAGFL